MGSSKVVLITGTRKGIGRYLAEHFLAQGHQVVGCSRQESDLNHPKYLHFTCDVAQENSVVALFNQLRSQVGSLDILVNNAGIASMNHSLLTPGSMATKILETNVLGTFLFCREAAKSMRSKKSGRIVNFATVATPLKLEGEALYAASKAAVISLTQILARELASFGITVNAIGPTPIDTDLIRAVPKDKMDQLIARQAIQRMGKLGDVSNVIDFFVSEQSDFITGQTIFLGGV